MKRGRGECDVVAETLENEKEFLSLKGTKRRKEKDEEEGGDEWEVVSTNLVKEHLDPFWVYLSIPPILLSDLYCDLCDLLEVIVNGDDLQEIQANRVFQEGMDSSFFDWNSFFEKRASFLQEKLSKNFPSSSSSHGLEFLSNFASFIPPIQKTFRFLEPYKQGEPLSEQQAENLDICWERFSIMDKIMGLSDDEAFETATILPLRCGFKLKKEVFWIHHARKWFEKGSCVSTEEYIKFGGAALLLELFSRFVWARYSLQCYFSKNDEDENEEMSFVDQEGKEKVGEGEEQGESKEQGREKDREVQQNGNGRKIKKDEDIEIKEDPFSSNSDDSTVSEKDQSEGSDPEQMREDGDEESDDDEGEIEDDEGDEMNEGDEGDIQSDEKMNGEKTDEHEGVPPAPNLFFKQLDIIESIDRIEAQSFDLFEAAQQNGSNFEWDISPVVEAFIYLVIKRQRQIYSRPSLSRPHPLSPPQALEIFLNYYQSELVWFLNALGICVEDVSDQTEGKEKKSPLFSSTAHPFACKMKWRWMDEMDMRYVDQVYVSMFRNLSGDGKVSSSPTLLNLFPAMYVNADAHVDVSLTATCNLMREQEKKRGTYHESLESLVDSLNALLDEKVLLENQMASSSFDLFSGGIGVGGRSVASLAIDRRMEQGKKTRLAEIDSLVEQIQEELHRITTETRFFQEPKKNEMALAQREAKERKKKRLIEERYRKSEEKRITKLHKKVCVDICVRSAHSILLSLAFPRPPSSRTLLPASQYLNYSSFCLFSTPAFYGASCVGGYPSKFDLIASRASHVTPIQRVLDVLHREMRVGSIERVESYFVQKAERDKEKRKARKKKSSKEEAEESSEAQQADLLESFEVAFGINLLAEGDELEMDCGEETKATGRKRLKELILSQPTDKRTRHSVASSIVDQLAFEKFRCSSVIEPFYGSPSFSFPGCFDSKEGGSEAILVMTVHQLHDIVHRDGPPFSSVLSKFSGITPSPRVKLIVMDDLNEDMCSAGIVDWCPWPLLRGGCVQICTRKNEGKSEGSGGEVPKQFLKAGCQSQFLHLEQPFPSASPYPGGGQLQYFIVELDKKEPEPVSEYILDAAHVSLTSAGTLGKYWMFVSPPSEFGFDLICLWELQRKIDPETFDRASTEWKLGVSEWWGSLLENLKGDDQEVQKVFGESWVDYLNDSAEMREFAGLAGDGICVILGKSGLPSFCVGTEGGKVFLKVVKKSEEGEEEVVDGWGLFPFVCFQKIDVGGETQFVLPKENIVMPKMMVGDDLIRGFLLSSRDFWREKLARVVWWWQEWVGGKKGNGEEMENLVSCDCSQIHPPFSSNSETKMEKTSSSLPSHFTTEHANLYPINDKLFNSYYSLSTILLRSAFPLSSPSPTSSPFSSSSSSSSSSASSSSSLDLTQEAVMVCVTKRSHYQKVGKGVDALVESVCADMEGVL